MQKISTHVVSTGRAGPLSHSLTHNTHTHTRSKFCETDSSNPVHNMKEKAEGTCVCAGVVLCGPGTAQFIWTATHLSVNYPAAHANEPAGFCRIEGRDTTGLSSAHHGHLHHRSQYCHNLYVWWTSVSVHSATVPRQVRSVSPSPCLGALH